MVDRNLDGHSPNWWNRHPEQKAKAQAQKAKSLPLPAIPESKPKVDTNLLVTIVFGVAALFAVLLQWNGVVSVKWFPSLVVYFVLIAITVLAFWHWNVAMQWRLPKRLTLSSIIFVALAGVSAMGVRQQYKNDHRITVNASTPPKFVPPKTLKQLFESDFSDVNKWSGTQVVYKTKDGYEFTIDAQEHLDYAANSRFLSFYIPPSRYPEELLRVPAREYKNVIREIDKNKVETYAPGDTQTSHSDKLQFSGRIYLYVEDILTPRQTADLLDYYKNRGLDLQVRGVDYVALHSRDGMK